MGSLAGIARELYARTPAEFTAARNAAARELRPTDPTLAKAVATLRKPTPSAWLVNALARRDAGEFGELLLLGERLRAAQNALDAVGLARLTRERRQRVAALAVAADALATELGHPVSASVLDELALTLQAALADAAAADAVRSGRLVRAIAAVGFEPVDLTGAVAASDPAAVGAPAPADRAEAEAVTREAAEQQRAIAEANDRAADAAAEVEGVDERIRQVDRRRDGLEIELARAEAAVRDLRADITSVDRLGRSLQREWDRASRAAAVAEEQAERARGYGDNSPR